MRQGVAAHVHEHDQVHAERGGRGGDAVRELRPGRAWRPRARSPHRAVRPSATRRRRRPTHARASRPTPPSPRAPACAHPRSPPRRAAPAAGSIGRRSQVTPPTTGSRRRAAGRPPRWRARRPRRPPPPMPSTSGRRDREISRSASGVTTRLARAAIDSAYGASSTPASVTIAVTSSAGVTSNAGLKASPPVERAHAPRGSRSSIGIAPPSGVAGIDRRQRRRHVERHAVPRGQHGQGIGAHLVRHVAVRGDPVGAHHDAVDEAARHQRARRRVGHHAVRDAGLAQLPGGQAGALEQRTRLVHPDLGEPAALPGRAQHAARGPVAAGGERAGVAVRERARAALEQLGAEPGQPPVRLVLLAVQRGAPPRARRGRRGTARAPRRGSRRSAASSAAARRPRPRGRRRAPCRTRRPARWPARRARQAFGCSRPPARPSRSGSSAPPRAAPAGRAPAGRRPRSAAVLTSISRRSGPDSSRYWPATSSGVDLSMSTRAFSSCMTSSVRPLFTSSTVAARSGPAFSITSLRTTSVEL